MGVSKWGWARKATGSGVAQAWGSSAHHGGMKVGASFQHQDGAYNPHSGLYKLVRGLGSGRLSLCRNRGFRIPEAEGMCFGERWGQCCWGSGWVGPGPGGHSATRSDSFQSGPFQEGCCCEILWRPHEELFISARYSQLPGCCQGNGRSCFLGWPGRGACSHHCSLSSSCDLGKAEVSSVVQPGKRVTSTLARFLVSGRPSLRGLLENKEFV